MTDTRHRPSRGARADIAQPRLGPLGAARWAWRQLTSMRTALLLLLLVAVAAIPGSVWPQRSIDPTAVATYLDEHPSLGPWLDRLGVFEVFTSPWFSAIYLLLVVSLLGCIVPRTLVHARGLRAAPPRVPRRLERLGVHRSVEVDGDPDEVVERARRTLRSARYRLRPAGEGSERELSGETGYLRETGNLLFHIGVVVVVVALAWGYLVGWKADRIVPVGQSMTNFVGGYDTFAPGPLVDEDDLQPFTVRLDSLDVRFEEKASGAQFGAPRDFSAMTTVTPEPGAPSERRRLAVNAPLHFGGASVFLLGNGYAPVVTVRDPKGQVLYRQATPFLPQDGTYTSTGAVKVPGAQPDQLGFTGLFLPTAYDSTDGPASAFPDARNPVLVLSAYTGQLFSGRAQSVYTLDTSRMTRVRGSDGQPAQLFLRPGQTVQLPGGRGSVTFDRVDRWAGLSTRYNPEKPLVLGAALAALLGLVASLTVRRRRMFVRVTPAGPGRSRLELGALARGEDPLLGQAADRLLARLTGQSDRADGEPGRPA